MYIFFYMYTYIYLYIYTLENNWLVWNYKTDKISDMFKGLLSSQSLEQSLCCIHHGNSWTLRFRFKG